MNEPRPSDSIASLPEARAFYEQTLAGSHKINCHGKPATVVFERDATHIYSVSCDASETLDPSEIVERFIPGGRGAKRREVRKFNVERARLMSYILPAVSQYAVSVPEAGGRSGHEKTILYGPALGNGLRLRVVLRPGPGDAFTCVSAYPVAEHEFVTACRLKRAKFPP